MNYDYNSVKRMYEEEIMPLENAEKTFLADGKYYIMRFDGVGMTKRFKPQKVLFNWRFLQNMRKTFHSFCKRHSKQILLGFQCNDEISILISATKQEDDKSFNRKEKLLSLFASEISILFNECCAQIPPEENPEYVGERLNIFDARIFEVTQTQCVSYFCLRQAFGIEHILTRIKNKMGCEELDVAGALQFLKDRNSINVANQKKNMINEKELLFGNTFSPRKNIFPFEFDTKKDFLKAITFKK